MIKNKHVKSNNLLGNEFKSNSYNLKKKLKILASNLKLFDFLVFNSFHKSTGN